MTTDEHPSIRETLQHITRPVWILMAGMVINRLGNFLQIYLVLFLTNKGFGADSAGFALGAYGAGSVLGVLIAGTVADRIGYRMTIAGSMAAAGALTALIVHLPTMATILPVAALIGVCAQAYRPASSALLVEMVPEKEHVMVFAVYRLAFNIGTTAGPLLGAILIVYSYNLMFYIDAVTSIGFALFALQLPSVAAERRQAIAAGDALETKNKKSYRAIFADHKFMLFVFALFLNAVVYIQHVAVLPLQITADGHQPGFYAILLSLNALVVIVLELPLTKFVQRMPARLAVALGIGLVGLGMNLYIAGPAASMFIIATLMWTMGEIVGTPTASAYPGQIAPAGMRARYISASAFPMQIGYAIGPVAGVALWSWNNDAVWWACSIATIVAVAATLAGMRRPDPASDDTTPNEIIDLDATDLDPTSLETELVSVAPTAAAAE